MSRRESCRPALLYPEVLKDLAICMHRLPQRALQMAAGAVHPLMRIFSRTRTSKHGDSRPLPTTFTRVSGTTATQSVPIISMPGRMYVGTAYLEVFPVVHVHHAMVPC